MLQTIKHIPETCLTDCRDLIELAEELAVSQPGFQRDAVSWITRAREFLGEAGLNSYSGERKLEVLANELRTLWLKTSFDATTSILKSPPHLKSNRLPSRKQIWFEYERAFKPEQLENEFVKVGDTPKDWDRRHALFSSAMGALTTIGQVFAVRLDGVNPDKAVRLGMFGGYFETWRMLNYLHDRDFEVVHLDSNADVHTSIANGELDIMLLEPVSYDWDMDVFDIDGFHMAYAAAGAKAPRVVIIDITLVGTHFPLLDFLAGFKEQPPWMVLSVRSGLKLDQQGLELASVGCVDIFVPINKSVPVSAADAHERLAAARTVFGVGLSVNDAGALEAPWIFDQKRLWSFSEAIFSNNEHFASQINVKGGIFSKVAHPVVHAHLRGRKGAVAPFVMLHLPISQQRSFGHLVAILVHEVGARGLNWEMGSSFGFRGHRFEVIKANVQVRPNKDQYGLLKVAMGSRGGPSVAGIIELVNDIAAYPDWQTLKTAYAHVAPYVRGKGGLFVARPPRAV